MTRRLMWPALRLVLLSVATLVLSAAASFAADPEKTVSGPKPLAKTIRPETLAAQVKEIFRTRCHECHGGSSTNGGLKILDHGLLIKGNEWVVPGSPDASMIHQRVAADDDTAMPPEGQPRLAEGDLKAIRQWIAAGAPAFPDDVAQPEEMDKDDALAGVVGVDYVLKKILEHRRTLPKEQRPFVRYFSLNHLLTTGSTQEELKLHRDALAKAMNHLSLERKIVRPTSIDAPTDTVLAVDIRELGWHKRPFEVVGDDGSSKPSSLNLFDLALLEYPYAVIYEDSETFDRLVQEFFVPAGLARPIAYVRADWFASIATQAPLYEDFLQLPFELSELEEGLDVDSAANIRDGVAKRAGVTVSGVSRNNRVVERHPAKNGAYWKSFDFGASKGRENMFTDPINLNESGGEMVFSLPNGLNGYLITTNLGRRLDAAPTDIVTDKFAENKTVKNGLSCMRCHDNGIKRFADDVRPAVEHLPGSPGFNKRQVMKLYAPQKEMDELLTEDTDRFTSALEQALGGPQEREPLIPVSQRFLDAPLSLSRAAAELGLAESADLKSLFRAPQFAGLGLVPLASGGIVRRDMWEDYYDQIVRQMGLGIPIAPLDGLARTDYPSNTPACDVGLSTNRKNNVFSPGDELVLTVKNRSSKKVFIELVGTGAKGEKVILAPATTEVAAGGEFRFPSEGAVKIQPVLGKEHITLLACEKPFPAGELLRGKGVVDRVFHPFYQLQDGEEVSLDFDPSRMVKVTIQIETK